MIQIHSLRSQCQTDGETHCWKQGVVSANLLLGLVPTDGHAADLSLLGTTEGLHWKAGLLRQYWVHFSSLPKLNGIYTHSILSILYVNIPNKNSYMHFSKKYFIHDISQRQIIFHNLTITQLSKWNTFCVDWGFWNVLILSVLYLAQWFSTRGNFVPPPPVGDIWQCLKTSLVVTKGGNAADT